MSIPLLLLLAALVLSIMGLVRQSGKGETTWAVFLIVIVLILERGILHR